MTRGNATYCADFIRANGPQEIPGKCSPSLSRADAAKLKEALAKALGMSPEDFEKKIADAYLAEIGGLE